MCNMRTLVVDCCLEGLDLAISLLLATKVLVVVAAESSPKLEVILQDLYLVQSRQLSSPLLQRGQS